ncbi:hypothetical protein [Caldimonas sp. KR1-144]|uniref:hypothetical protein n=1 Tax=Caldimonas sp. KR1-144 TaxID=3400911 RepID=UPI003C0FACCB
MHQSPTDMRRVAASSSDVDARATLLSAVNAIERKDAALKDACDLLEGWVRFKCTKRYQAEHFAHIEKLRSALSEVAAEGGDCPVCDGSGEVATLQPGSRHFARVPCETCGGDGCIGGPADLATLAEQVVQSETNALATQCSDFATSLRSAFTVAALKGEAPASFRKAAELLERAASALTDQAQAQRG